MHPYREPGQVAPVRPRTESDDRSLSILLIAIGAIRVAIAIATREAFGAEATIATVMIALGLAGVAPRSSDT